VTTNIFEPFRKKISFSDGSISPDNSHWTRRLSEITEIFIDGGQVSKILSQEDPIIYEVFDCTVPEEEGHLIPVTTRLYPGRVGNEFYMTKGHFHSKRGTAEVYVILQGEGVLVMQTEIGRTAEQVFTREDLLYIPPYWAHRMVNTGNSPLVFYGVYPANAGHDYRSVADRGFAKRVMFDSTSNNGFKVIPSGYANA